MSAAIGMPKSASNPVNQILEEKPSVQILNRAPGAPVQAHINLKSRDLPQVSNTEKLQKLVDFEGLQILYNDYGRVRYCFTQHSPASFRNNNNNIIIIKAFMLRDISTGS